MQCDKNRKKQYVQIHNLKNYELVNQIFHWPQIRHEYFRLIYDSFFAFPHVDEPGIGVFIGSLRQNLRVFRSQLVCRHRNTCVGSRICRACHLCHYTHLAKQKSAWQGALRVFEQNSHPMVFQKHVCTGPLHPAFFDPSFVSIMVQHAV